MKWVRDSPWWVFAIALGLASIEPITHLALQRIDNEQAVHSGLHVPDSSIYLASMRMLDNDFFSPYATCKAPNGPNDPAFLPTPFHWLYAILGEIGRWFGIGEFMFLGLANGFFGFIYLVVVYRFLRTAVPDLANLAFVLWALGGGLGGVTYLGALALGADSAANFEAVSFRFVMYELIEGAGLFPILHIPRLYYTTSLALGFGFLSALITSIRIDCRQHLLFAAILLFGSAVINIRFGAFAWSIGIMYLVCRNTLPMRGAIALSIMTLLPVLAAGLVYVAMQWSQPIFTETALAIVRESLWPTGFAAAGALFVPLLCMAAWREMRALPPIPRLAAAGASGYLLALVPLFGAYQVYYGNYWSAGEHAALARVSDFALIGAAAGAAVGWTRFQRTAASPDGYGWFVVWALVFLAAGMSAFGQGWGVRLAPQRYLAMLGVPLAVCAAMVLRARWERFPVESRLYAGAIVFCGIASILAGSVFFQAPTGRRPQTQLYAERHPELITPDEAALVQSLRPGVVLTAPEFADVAALRSGVRVIGGIGSTDLSDLPSTHLDELFPKFAADVRHDGPFRREDMLQAMCVEYILLPERYAALNEFMEGDAYHAYPLVERVGSAGLYAVEPRAELDRAP